VIVGETGSGKTTQIPQVKLPIEIPAFIGMLNSIFMKLAGQLITL